jgi:hypothetical protein
MDNITPLVPGTVSPCVVTLNAFQNAYYQHSSLEIHSPKGERLEVFGRDVQKENLHHNNLQLRNQICLVETLLSHIDRDVDLPKQAVCGLADLLFRMEEFFEGSMKQP